MPKQMIVLVLLMTTFFWQTTTAKGAPVDLADILTITDLPSNGSFIVLDGDFGLSASEDLLLVDTDNSQLLIWDLQPTDHIDAVLNRHPILLGDKIVGEDGRYVIPTPPDGSLLALSLVSRQMAYRTQDADELWVANLDGTGARLLVNTVMAGAALWSPDGRILLFEDRFRIRRINDDGSGLSTLIEFPGLWVKIAAWSPDSNELALTTLNWLYYLSVSDGALTRLMAASPQDVYLSNSVAMWSPDSSTLAIQHPRDNLQFGLSLWKTGEDRLDHIFDAGVLAATWSPDGKQLAIWGSGDCAAEFDAIHGYRNRCGQDLYVVNIDGSGLTRLTELNFSDSELDEIGWFSR